MSITDQMKSVSVKKKSTPVWQGPEGTGPNGGITFSLLSKWLVCKERCRILMVEGLKPTEKWNHKIEFGNMFHLCDEVFTKTWAEQSSKREPTRTEDAISSALNALWEYAETLVTKYPYSQEDIDKWFNVARVLFPEYVKYWKTHKDMVDRVPLLQEEVFDVPYRLPSGRTVRLRGKWDGIDLVGRGKDQVLVLHESKTKGDIDAENIQRTLTFDCQTMLYLVALQEWKRTPPKNRPPHAPRQEEKYHPIEGVRYNVVRRPLSGGKGTIVQKKGSKNVPAETKSEFYDRLAQYIKDEPESYFMRWDTPVTTDDIERFKERFLDPCLEMLCLWWDKITGRPWTQMQEDAIHNALHWQTPFGVPNNLMDGGWSEYDQYITSGSEIGLRRVDSLFPELGG